MATAKASAQFARDDVAKRIVSAVAALDIKSMPAWNEIKPLATRTDVDGVRAHPAGIQTDGKNFDGLLNIYVVLQYDTNGRKKFLTSDTVPGRFVGHFDEMDRPVIDTVEVDTRRFYE